LPFQFTPIIVPFSTRFPFNIWGLKFLKFRKIFYTPAKKLIVPDITPDPKNIIPLKNL
jgi:hypothetical protein